MDLKDIELESEDWIDLEIRQPNQWRTTSQTKYNFRDNSSKRSTQRVTQHLPHGMNSPHLSFKCEHTNNHRHSSFRGQLPPTSLRSRPPRHQFSHSKLQPEDPI